MYEILEPSEYIKMGVCPFCTYKHMGCIGRGKMLALVNHITGWHESEYGERYQHAYSKISRHYQLMHG